MLAKVIKLKGTPNGVLPQTFLEVHLPSLKFFQPVSRAKSLEADVKQSLMKESYIAADAHGISDLGSWPRVCHEAILLAWQEDQDFTIMDYPRDGSTS